MIDEFAVDPITQNFYKQRQGQTNYDDSSDKLRAINVGWNSCKSQFHSFEISTNLSWINWKKVNSFLDVGCGYGNLIEYLSTQKKYQGKYLGIDIIPEFIQTAQKLYGSKDNASFILGDFLEQDWHDQKFDIVVSLGSLGVNYDYPHQCGSKSQEYAQNSINLIAKIANLGISLYFPNADYIDISKRKPRMAYYQASAIEQMVLSACGSRCQEITFISYPKQKDLKTIAQIKLLPFTYT